MFNGHNGSFFEGDEMTDYQDKVRHSIGGRLLGDLRGTFFGDGVLVRHKRGALVLDLQHLCDFRWTLNFFRVLWQDILCTFKWTI